LNEWARIVKPGGAVVLVLPKKESNFDHRRPEHDRGSADHYVNDVGEDDLTHLDEILALHDLKRDKPAGTPAQFRERSCATSRTGAYITTSSMPDSSSRSAPRST
jgi:hypothetical protein